MGRKDLRLSQRVAEQVADTMFALSTPSRVQILRCLLNGPHAVVDIMEALAMEQSAVSHQLRVLRDHRLVKGDKVGWPDVRTPRRARTNAARGGAAPH
jgi:DNA-binding transcriptional ArsR family regulator